MSPGPLPSTYSIHGHSFLLSVGKHRSTIHFPRPPAAQVSYTSHQRHLRFFVDKVPEKEKLSEFPDMMQEHSASPQSLSFVHGGDVAYALHMQQRPTTTWNHASGLR